MDYRNIHKEDLQGGVQFKKFNLVISDAPRMFFTEVSTLEYKNKPQEMCRSMHRKHVPLCKMLGQKFFFNILSKFPSKIA